MSESVRIVTVDATNVEQERFFCFKSKPKSLGYARKRDWLKERFAEGLRIRIVYEGSRPAGFVETIPGEFAWRAIQAPGYLVIHCLWVVGRDKKKGYGSRLLSECLEDARQAGKHGVVMVSSSQTWLAGSKLFLKNGFEAVGQAPPCFELLVRRLDDAPPPTFPTDWDERLGRYGPGFTVVYSDQCPYIEGVLRGVLAFARDQGVEARAVKLVSSRDLQEASPSAYGVFNIVYNGELVTYHFLDGKAKRRFADLSARG